jgi:small subunit ribosomal protein S17
MPDDAQENETEAQAQADEGAETAETQASASATADAPADAAQAAATEVEAPQDVGSGEAAVSSDPAPPAEPEVLLAPKERRRRVRSTHVGEARAPRTAEERHVERAAERVVKAVRRRARRAQERAKRAQSRAASPASAPLAPVHAPTEGARKVRQGIVVSDKADKTITVRIDVARRHQRYEKIVRSSATLHAHDENNDARHGDTVRVIESRPLSRTKRWRLLDILERAR